MEAGGIIAHVKRGRKILLAALGLAIVAVLAVASWLGEKEPEYKGRKLSEWLIAYSTRSQTNGPMQQQAEDAVRHIGTNALPFLVEWIGYEPPRWKDKLVFTILRVPNPFPRNAAVHLLWSRNSRATVASYGFQILGEEAAPAVPALERMVRDWSSPVRASVAFGALTFVGKDGLHPMVAVMTNKAAPSSVRCGAAMLITCRPTMNLGTNAISVARAMLPCLQDMSVAACFAEMLATLRVVPEEVVPALDRCLRSPNNSLRIAAARALGAFRRDASSAVPDLLIAANDANESVRITVTNALLDIAPEVLKKEEP